MIYRYTQAGLKVPSQFSRKLESTPFSLLVMPPKNEQSFTPRRSERLASKPRVVHTDVKQPTTKKPRAKSAVKKVTPKKAVEKKKKITKAQKKANAKKAAAARYQAKKKKAIAAERATWSLMDWVNFRLKDFYFYNLG